MIEAEYIAISQAVQQTIWLSFFFNKTSLFQRKPITLFINDNGAINMIKTYKRAKYINI